MSENSREIEIELPELHPAQERIRREARRFNVVACGRRFGKSLLGIDLLLEPALEGYPVAWFSPTYKMLTEIWREVRTLTAPLHLRVSAQERRIELITGGIIDMWSLDTPDVARGRRYRRVITDEAGMIAALKEAWLNVIRPTLADYEGDGWLLGTPKGRNFFWQAFQWGQDPNVPEWGFWQMPTSANPYIKPSEIEAMRRDLPERVYQQEIEAAFLDDGGGVFRRVLDAARATEQTHALAGHSYVIGVDWGKFNDFSCFAVIDTAAKELVALDRFNQLDWSFQRGRLVALWERFGRCPVLAESNSIGEPNIEALQREAIPVQPFHTSNASKGQAIDALALAFERGDLAIIPDPILTNELLAYQAERLPSGVLRYGAPDGMHDDTVMALAIAWHGATYGQATYGHNPLAGYRG